MIICVSDVGEVLETTTYGRHTSIGTYLISRSSGLWSLKTSQPCAGPPRATTPNLYIFHNGPEQEPYNDCRDAIA